MVRQLQEQTSYINPSFIHFIDNEVLIHTNIKPNRFWGGLISIIEEFSSINCHLLKKRKLLQEKIDAWHMSHAGNGFQLSEYQDFLTEIGYIVDEGGDFRIATENVDDEIATIAAPQLVVPLSNARFALNAVNARWGSLYDALYGSDVIALEGEQALNGKHNDKRAREVTVYAKSFLDTVFPLVSGSHHDAMEYRIEQHCLVVRMQDHSTSELKQPNALVAFNCGTEGINEPLTTLVLKNNDLHIQLIFDRCGIAGKNDLAGINDIRVEAAVTAIMDCEDSVATVDAEEKIEVYRNWLGLIKGDLQVQFDKQGQVLTRTLNQDRKCRGIRGEEYTLKSRALMLIRNVGLLLTSDIVVDEQGDEIPEGILDAVVTTLIASLERHTQDGIKNSEHGSIYIVKPKLHGPEEVAYTCDLFTRIESLLELERNTIKLGIMDEERRTTLNLKACIRAAKERVVFINTGFLDRTGDEIHTAMYAGAFLPKSQIKEQAWMSAYENWNVDIGIECGFSGRAQIGKGMWAMPDEMKGMVDSKIAHPLAGANTAWVPSPTAAVLHSMHYHLVNVRQRQQQLACRPRAQREDMLQLALIPPRKKLSKKVIQKELENNLQGILGYVVRWVELGIGCSKVPDIDNVNMMEDRATLRISCQHIANWLLHGICSPKQVLAVMDKMAGVVDSQNRHTDGYVPMTPDTRKSIAFQAAKQLIFNGLSQPNGYTEPVLNEFRRLAKTQKS